MRWNPFFDLWTILRLDYAYGKVARALPPFFGDWMVFFSMCVWLAFSLISVPIPVKATGFVGEPVEVRECETEEELSERLRNALQHLIDSVRGNSQLSRSYSLGLYRWKAKARTTLKQS